MVAKSIKLSVVTILIMLLMAGNIFAGYRLQFAGNDDYVNMDYSALDGLDQFTIDYWIYLESPGASISAANAVNDDEYLNLFTTGGEFYPVVQNNTPVSGIPTYLTEVWFHVAVTVDAVSGEVIAYFDGEEAGSWNFAGLTPLVVDQDGLVFGQNVAFNEGNTVFSDPLEGSIDELRIWNTVLSDLEIIEVMNRPVIAYDTRLQAYYNFDEGSGQVVDDISPYLGNSSGRLGDTYLADNADPVWEISFAPEFTAEIFFPYDRHLFYKGWSMISLPLEPGDTAIEAIFGDDIIQDWQLISFSTADGFQYPTTAERGPAYWLTVIFDPLTMVDIDGVPDTDPFIFNLDWGWNMIGCPFNEYFPLNRAQFHYDGSRYTYEEAVDADLILPIMYTYDPMNYHLRDYFEPWKGYWFLSRTTGVEMELDLTYYPPVVKEYTPELDAVSSDNWRIQILASADDFIDGFLRFGVQESATDGFDPMLDHPEPPIPPMNAINIFFSRDTWLPDLGSRFISDLRTPFINQSNDWNFTVDQTGVEVTLLWYGLARMIPQGFQATLTDLLTETTINMFNENSYTFQSGGVREFAIHINASTQGVDETANVPQNFELLQAYPNPFNATTTVSYRLPTAGTVDVSVFDVNGRLVAALSKGHRDAGTYKVSWNAENLASGLYLVRLVGKEVNTSRKIVLLK